MNIRKQREASRVIRRNLHIIKPLGEIVTRLKKLSTGLDDMERRLDALELRRKGNDSFLEDMKLKMVDLGMDYPIIE